MLLDEPTSGLDLDHMAEVARLIKDLAARGTCVVLVTHDREFLNLCCDWVLELRRPERGTGASFRVPAGASDARRARQDPLHGF